MKLEWKLWRVEVWKMEADKGAAVPARAASRGHDGSSNQIAIRREKLGKARRWLWEPCYRPAGWESKGQWRDEAS